MASPGPVSCHDVSVSLRMSHIGDNCHSIILAQFTDKPNSKHYSDHETVSGAMEAVCQLFEAKLKQMNPDKKKITYDITDLFEFIDSLPDLGVLVYDSEITAYTPHSKEWIKKRIFNQLKKLASK